METSAYGSEMVTGRIGVNHCVELEYTLRMMGVPVEGRTLLFGDNESMVKNTTLPRSTLKKWHNAVAYHRVKQVVVLDVVGMVHYRSVTTSFPHHKSVCLTKELVFRFPCESTA